MSAMTVTPWSGPHALPARALTLVADAAEAATPGSAPVRTPTACAARPSTGFVHRDGACRCFAGGPAPEFAPSRLPTPRGHLTVAPTPAP